MKHLLTTAAVSVFALAFGSAHAAITTTYVGNNLGNGPAGQDNFANVTAVIQANNFTPVDVFLAKLDECDDDGKNCTTEADGAVAANLFEIIDDTGKEGGLNFDLTGTGYQLEYFSVKGGNGFSVYALDTPAASGMLDWTLGLLTNNGGNVPALSHMSFFGSLLDVEEEVPLPAAAPLFAAGLAGFGFFGSRRRKSA